MTIGQIVFLVGMVLFLLYVLLVRRRTTDRILFILFGLAGIVMVLVPSLTTTIAAWLGIGRGVDLVIYLFMILCLFYAVSTSAEINSLRAQITDLTRKDALEHPLRTGKNEGGKTK